MAAKRAADAGCATATPERARSNRFVGSQKWPLRGFYRLAAGNFWCQWIECPSLTPGHPGLGLVVRPVDVWSRPLSTVAKGFA